MSEKKSKTAYEAAKWLASKTGKKELQEAISDGEEMGQRMIVNSEASAPLLCVPYTM